MVAGVAGAATFRTMSIDKAAPSCYLAASDGTLGSGTSAPFHIAPAAADRVVFGQQPLNGATDTPLNPAPTVRILDHLDNLVTSDTSMVTMTIFNNPSGGN